jgi:type IV pilus assembly protein PilN
MIRVNLLPYRAARIKENIRRQVTIYILSTLFLILFFGIFPYNPISYVALNKEVKSLRQKRDDRKKELASYRDTTVKIKALEKTKAEIDVKLGKINELKKVKTGPVRLLDDIATSVPKDKLWLTALKENKGILVLEGTAMDNETVADFMNRLKDTRSVRAVELVRTKQKEIKELNLNLKDFALTCQTYAFREEQKAPPQTGKKRKKR